MNRKTFKDFMMKDLDVFFNDMEFAEEHELDGEVLLCVIVNSDTRDSGTGQSNATQEVFEYKKTVYVKKEDFFIPRVGSVLTLDGDEFYVEGTDNQQGVLRIVLSANES